MLQPVRGTVNSAQPSGISVVLGGSPDQECTYGLCTMDIDTGCCCMATDPDMVLSGSKGQDSIMVGQAIHTR